MKPDLSYVNLQDRQARVVCVCGWESDSFQRGPFDPAEALVAYSVDHLVCSKEHPKTYYAVASSHSGKMVILGDAEENSESKMVEMAKGLCQKGRSLEVVKIVVVSSWVG